MANSILDAAQLGARTALIGRLGADAHGKFYQDECAGLGVKLANPLVDSRSTATCLSIITPDAERTMRTCLAVSAELSPADISRRAIEDSEWLLIEGYVLANGDGPREAVRSALKVARDAGTKVAFTVSESWVVTSFADAVNEVVSQSDMVFCNASEACALSGASTEDEAFEALSRKLPGVAITAGGRGAFVSWGGSKGFVEAFPCVPVDLTGAGDMFAGALLYGLVSGAPLLDTARRACFLCREVITQIGARLDADLQALWRRAATE